MFTLNTLNLMVLVTSVLLGFTLTASIMESDTLTDGTELVFTLTMQRHGDKTPDRSQYPLINYSYYGDGDVITPLIEPYGYGQLTNKGIRTAYKTGEFIRRRYKDFLPLKYNDSKVYIRSTDVTRTKMSILSAMAAAFPPAGDTWSNHIHWVPVPYTTQEAKYDTLLGVGVCPDWVRVLQQTLGQPADLTPYEDTVKAVSVLLDYQNLINTPLMMIYVNDVYTSLISLGYDVGSQVRTLMPAIAAAAAKAWDVILADDNLVTLAAGPLLNNFFTYAKMVISGQDTPRARIYSGHDINIYTLEAATLVTERQGIPKYGSLYALELRRVLETGQYVVLPVYLSDPNKGLEKYLQFQGCGKLCDFDEFYDLTKKYLIDDPNWRSKCVFEDSVSFFSNL